MGIGRLNNERNTGLLHFSASLILKYLFTLPWCHLCVPCVLLRQLTALAGHLAKTTQLFLTVIYLNNRLRQRFRCDANARLYDNTLCSQ
jgi:hypothetical protein